jgi:hypothetical protein
VVFNYRWNCDLEYSYIPGYISEDESNDTSHEIGTLEAVDSEILGDYDAYCLYSLGPVYEFVCISFRTDNLNCFKVS